MLEGGAEHGFEPADEEVGSGDGDILRRIAGVLAEIEGLKRERHAASVFGARARLATVYFEKRKRQAAPAEAA